MSAGAPTRPDERCKREQCFRCPERARISWGRATRGRVRGRDLSLSRSGQRHIDAPWPRKFNPGPHVPEHVLDTGDQSRPVATLWLPVCRLIDRAKRRLRSRASGTWASASLTGQTDWSKALVPQGTDRNPAGRSQPASIGDHWLCPWYSAPSFSSSARIVATRLSRILTI